MTNDTTVAPDRCLLCGGPNLCGMAAGQTDCWCFTARVPQALLDQLPPESRNLSCICQRCIASYEQRGEDHGNREEAGRRHE
jgi:hypothetical protein